MNHVTIRIEGGLLSPDFLEGIHEVTGQKPQDFGLKPRSSLVDEVTAVWADARAYWEAYQRRAARAQSGRGESLTTITREQWVLPLLEALGYSLSYQRRATEVDGRSYTISHRADTEDGLPVHIVAADQDLGDRPPSGRGTLSPHALLQDYLNRTDEHLWGIVTNGRILRLLRDSTYFTRPAYIEFDLQTMLEGERLDEFFLLYRLAQRSRLPLPDERPSDCLLEQYYQLTLEQGGRIRDGLRQAVADAIVTFANGFLRHPRNIDLRRRIESGDLSVDDFYQQLLYLIYRLLFLMVAEERNLLELAEEQSLASAPPLPRSPASFYRQYVSISRLRVLADTPLSAPERFDDLYLGLRTLFFALHDETLATRLNIPALNGELFSNEKAPDLDAAHLNNRDLLHAIRLLSYFTPPDEKVRRRVNYAALDVEELGSVYESLLDEQPVLDGGRVASSERQGSSGQSATRHSQLTFSFISGTTRKTTGSYYTPRELVNEVIKSALVPVIEDRLTNADKSPISNSPISQSPQEAALLALRVCDPACGSGHFLLAAARRIGYELAKVRSGADEPSPRQIRAATRDAITHCIYGVDKNPLAVDLCKVALWIEGYSRGKPLTFLDYRVRCGDSLVGMLDLDVLEEGIPRDAYKPVSGDDKKVARSLRDQNKEERAGQSSLFDQFSGAAAAPDPVAWQNMEAMPEETPAQVNAKRAAYQRLRQQGDRLRTAANLWTSAFFSRLTADNMDLVPTTETVRRWRLGQSLSQQVVGTANGMAEENRFFHWRLEFPQVFKGGGFDVIVGNPPWEQIQPEEIKFFGTSSAPEIAQLAGSKRKAAIKKLPKTKPALAQRWKEYQRIIKNTSVFIRGSARFEKSAVGRLNTYPLFTELSQLIIKGIGRVGIIVPTGIASDKSTSQFFSSLVQSKVLAQLIGFENEAFIFPEVHHSYKFCILSFVGKDMIVEEGEFIFFCRYFHEIYEEDRQFTLSRSDFESINPNTLNCPIFRTKSDAELTKKIYRHTPVLFHKSNGENPWNVNFRQGLFNMTSDSNLFSTKEMPKYLPLYEAKMIWHFDHRYSTYEGATQAQLNVGSLPKLDEAEHQDPFRQVQPRYWVPKTEITTKLSDWNHNWLIGFRDVTSAVVERTAIFSVIAENGVGHTMPLVFPGTDSTLKNLALLANFNALAFDFVVRQKLGGTHLTYFILEQLPVFSPSQYSQANVGFIAPIALELVYTAWDIAPFAADIWQEADEPLRQALRARWEANRQATGGYAWPQASQPWAANGGQKPPFPPFKWDDDRRAHLRAELDAYYARLYGLARDELRYILDPEDIYGPDFPGETFRVLKEKEIKRYGEYRTQRLVLAAWDAQQAAIDGGELVFETTQPESRGVEEQRSKGEVQATAGPESTPAAPAVSPKAKEEPSTLELKSPTARPKAKPKAARQPALDVQPALVTEFTPPQGGYAQRLKRVMALGKPKNQLELTELIAALGDENDNIRWLASSALSRLGGLPVVKLLAAYLDTAPGPTARAEVVRVLETIAAASEDDGVRTAVGEVLDG